MCCNGFININISTDVFRIFALNMILMLVIMITTVARKSNKLCYDITGEYNLDLISSISKYATCIFNDGEGGYIKWNSNSEKMFDINDVVSAMRSEISKIKPVVHEMKYQLTILQPTAEVLIEIAPVPWGLEAYAAPDGHVYIAGVAEDLTNANSLSNNNSDIKHENNIETQDDIAMETSDYYECLLIGDVPKAEEKETGMLPCEIKSIIDDCVQDLRDIKSTLGIHSTLERPAKEEINTLPQQKSSTKKKLHHCKSQSDQLYNESQQSVRHWKSDPVVSDISGSNGFKTLCEEIHFSPCRDGKPLPSKSTRLLQVDGEGRGDIGDGLDTSDYVLPQLDGVYDQNIVKEESNSDGQNIVREESNSGSEAYKLQEFSDLQKYKSSFVIFWLGLVIVALVQYGSGQIVVPIPYPAISDERLLLYTDAIKMTVGTITFDGKSFAYCLPTNNFLDPEAITYDPSTNVMYLIDDRKGRLYKLPLDGRSQPNNHNYLQQKLQTATIPRLLNGDILHTESTRMIQTNVVSLCVVCVQVRDSKHIRRMARKSHSHVNKEQLEHGRITSEEMPIFVTTSSSDICLWKMDQIYSL